MSILINYTNKLSNKNISNLVLFVDDKFNISSIKKHISLSDYSFVSDLIKVKDPKKKNSNF